MISSSNGQNIGEASKLMNAFFNKLKELAYENNLSYVIISHTYNSFTPKGSQALTIPYSNSATYVADTIGVCYRDKDDNDTLKFHVEKSRSGNYIKNIPILNLSAIIKSIKRKEKIAKLLAIN